MSYKIAVDGTAGSGKSTICKLIAQRLNFVFISTGGFYRSYAYILKQSKLLESDKDTQISELNKHVIDIKGDVFYIDNQNLKNELREEDISKLASLLAQKDYIREYAKQAQIDLGNKYEKVIMDGRDIGTEIIPDANLKFYFYSSLLERTKRRKNELVQNNNKVDSFLKIYIDMFKRDWNDKHRKVAPLKKAAGAISINTSNKSIEDVYKEVVKYIGE